MDKSYSPSFDSPAWWENREYEHKSEALALSKLLSQIEKRKSIIDMGGGFGRLTPVYAPFFSKITFIEDNEKLLSLAKSYLENIRGIEFKKGEPDKMPVGPGLFDVALGIRLLHKVDISDLVAEAHRILDDSGFLILQVHRDMKKTREIEYLLQRNNFLLINLLSVTNFRFRFFKKLLPISFLLKLEDKLDKIKARLRLGESTFILAQKEASSAQPRLGNLVRKLNI